MLEELLQAILVHLNGTDVLLLFDVNVRNVHPNIAEVSRSFAHLSKNITGLIDTAFMRQHSANTVRCPNVLWISFQYLQIKLIIAIS